MSVVDENELSLCVRKALAAYFEDLDGEPAANVYEMIIRCVERPMLEVALERVGFNQSRAAQILGINRNTLRRKMRQYGIE